MKISEDYFFWGNFSKELPPSKVWKVIFGVLSRCDSISGTFEVQVGMLKSGATDAGRTIKVMAQDVLAELQKGGEEAFLTVRKVNEKNRQIQSFRYFPNDGMLNIHFSANEFTEDIDLLASRLCSSFSVSNAVVSLKQYVRSQASKRQAGKTNLLEAPAERNFRDGYIEGISAEMWLGELFWEYGTCSKQDVLSCTWLQIEDRGSYLHVVAWPSPFTTAEGEQGSIQRKLLKLLFGIE